MQGAPIYVLNANLKRETGKKAQFGNINAAKAVSDIVRTALGPKAMLKMLLDPQGGIVITNDGNSILRELEVSHPAAKTMIELSRAQDEEVGDGTTSVIILAGEMLYVSENFLNTQIHPTVIIRAYFKALEDALKHMNEVAWKVDVNNREELLRVVQTCIGTKFTSRWGRLVPNLAIDAVTTIVLDKDGQKEVDVKRYVKVEKIPGGELEDSKVIRGVMMNKDVTHAKMKRRVEKPRILLLDCGLEYKKGESQTSYEITKESDFTDLLNQEKDQVTKMCNDIIKFKPDVVVTEKGLSDLAQQIFVNHGIVGLRRLRKTDNNRIARATGATIVNRTDEIKESDIGTKAGLFEVNKIGDEYWTFITECTEPKACTILLRGGSKDVLNEIERNIQDALSVARNIVYDPRLVPGGGAIEMSTSVYLSEKSKSVLGIEQGPYNAVASALEVIPKTLAQNCGANVVKVLTELRAKHADKPKENTNWGINGDTGVLTDMKELGVWEPLAVKIQTVKTAIESACMLLRVDTVLSGLKKKGEPGAGGGGPAPGEDQMMAGPE